MNRWVIVVSMVVALSAQPAFAQGQQGSSPSQPEMVQIDGAKNPELIPQWSAWGYAFRVIAGGPRQLPSTVHRVVSKEEAAMVLQEADAVQRVDRVCQEQLLKLHPLVGREKAEVLDARLREITVECRRKTLDARDRVLSALNPEAATALVIFVEDTKKGTSISIPKRDLARFREPE